MLIEEIDASLLGKEIYFLEQSFGKIEDGHLDEIFDPEGYYIDYVNFTRDMISATDLDSIRAEFKKSKSKIYQKDGSLYFFIYEVCCGKVEQIDTDEYDVMEYSGLDFQLPDKKIYDYEEVKEEADY